MPVLGPAELPEGTLSASLLEALPGKVPLIKKTWRPPNFETPVSYFNDAFTRNDAADASLTLHSGVTLDDASGVG